MQVEISPKSWLQLSPSSFQLRVAKKTSQEGDGWRCSRRETRWLWAGLLGLVPGEVSLDRLTYPLGAAVSSFLRVPAHTWTMHVDCCTQGLVGSRC